ncbi:MAG: 2-iminoacetate synthase ThiH [Candidatus Ancillula sp.]|jgi:2-iminoacetate synthase|nr:2-iminoacetate synthase ThiH [Candidatus Ancillula sp.]
MLAVLEQRNAFDYEKFTHVDVKHALEETLDFRGLSLQGFMALLSPAAAPLLEELAQAAQRVKKVHFGNNISLFTPLYIANYCEDECTYCGFSRFNKIKRAKLTDWQIESECKEIVKSGLEEVLILTGESQAFSNYKYIGQACKTAKKYFRAIGIEVQPMNVDEYKYLHNSGADFVTVFQETYDTDVYDIVHPGGRKRIFPYRFDTAERALLGGFRGVAFGALLGLADFRKDALAVGLHAMQIQKKFPHAEISISCPRIRPILGDDNLPSDIGVPLTPVTEEQLLQIICAYRLFLPFANITVSTRENEKFRNEIFKIAATKISAGVSVGVGGHGEEAVGDEQFEIDDVRSVPEICKMLKNAKLQPVMSEYMYL